MKKIVSFAVLFVVTSMNHSFGQTTSKTETPSPLLSLYYDIKDALISGNANTAAAKSEDFIKALNGIDSKTVSEAGRNALLKEAGYISETKDIKRQREHFAPLSDNMIILAKTQKLSAAPVYQQYCPMKKASWLSNRPEIKNPYYGSAMLTCGTVKATL